MMHQNRKGKMARKPFDICRKYETRVDSNIAGIVPSDSSPNYQYLRLENILNGRKEIMLRAFVID